MFLKMLLSRPGPDPGWTGPARAGRARAGPGPKMKMSIFTFFWIPGVKKVKINFAAKYAIWKHLDSSSLESSQKSRPKPPVGGKHVRQTPQALGKSLQ